MGGVRRGDFLTELGDGGGRQREERDGVDVHDRQVVSLATTLNSLVFVDFFLGGEDGRGTKDVFGYVSRLDIAESYAVLASLR